jgi:hypothetical protein
LAFSCVDLLIGIALVVVVADVVDVVVVIVVVVVVELEKFWHKLLTTTSLLGSTSTSCRTRTPRSIFAPVAYRDNLVKVASVVNVVSVANVVNILNVANVAHVVNVFVS